MKSDVNIFKEIFTAASLVGIFSLHGRWFKKVSHSIIIIGIELILLIIRLDFIITHKVTFNIANLITDLLTTFIFQFVCLLDMIYNTERVHILFKIFNKLDIKFRNIGKKSLQIYLPSFLFLTTTALDIALLMYGYNISYIYYIFELLLTIQLSSHLLTICQFCYILSIKFNTLNTILNDTFAKAKYGHCIMYIKIREVGYYLSLLNKAACNFKAVTGKKNLVLLIMLFGNILSTFYSIMSIYRHSYQTARVLILYYRLIIALVST